MKLNKSSKTYVLTFLFALEAAVADGTALAAPYNQLLMDEEAAYNHGDFPFTISLGNKLLAQDPRNVRARYYLAEALLRQNRMAEAKRQYEVCREQCTDPQMQKYVELALSNIRALNSSASDNQALDNLGPNNLVPNNLVPNKITPNNLVPNNLIPNNLIPNNLIRNNMIPNNLIPNILAPNYSASNAQPVSQPGSPGPSF